MSGWTVIGVDPSARKLVAVCTRGTASEVVIHKLPTDIVQRCAQAYLWMQEITEAAPRPVAIFIESPFIGKFKGSGMVLAKIHGPLLAAAIIAGADIVMPVDNRAWKAKVVGKIPRGTDHKRAIRKYMRMHWFELWQESGDDQDVMDAACINRYGEAILRMRKLIARSGIGTVKRLPVRRPKR